MEYRKAADKKANSFEAAFNMADALYKQKKYDEALEQFSALAKQETDKERLGEIYHNIGNTLLAMEKIDAIREAIKELERAGYIVRSRERDEKGRLRGTDYVIFEQPQTSPVSDLPTLDNPTLEKPTQEKPTLENPTQLNKDIQKTDLPKKEKSNTDLSSTDSIYLPQKFYIIFYSHGYFYIFYS